MSICDSLSTHSTRGTKISGRLSTLLKDAQEDLVSLGAPAGAGNFVCPLCLRLLPLEQASVGHYPARSVPALARRSALVCRGCNSFMGSGYEADAALFLATGLWSTRMTFPGGGRVGGTVEASQDAGAYKMRMTGPRMGKLFNEMRSRSADPATLEVEMWRPHEDVGKRALLAWSLLEWSKFAGYRYLASAGAEHARRLALDDDLPLPQTVFVRWEEMKTPLDEPEALLVTWAPQRPRSIVDDDLEFLGIGTRWGGAMITLPFANDQQGAVWERIAAKAHNGKIGGLWPWPLPKLMDRLGYNGLHTEMRLQDEDKGLDFRVTEDLSPEDAALIARGAHPRRLVPPTRRRGPRQRGTAYRMTVKES